jgi:hypothetical protein
MRGSTLFAVILVLVMGALCAACSKTSSGGRDAGGDGVPAAEAGASDAPTKTPSADASKDVATAPATNDAALHDEAPSRADGGDGARADGNDDARADAAMDAPAIALPAKVLLYHFSTLVIDSVPAQLTFFENLLVSWGYATDDSVDPAKFTDEGLGAYAAVAMINTCFFPFGDQKDGAPESAALQRFLTRGGGLFGTHCAAVTFQSTSPPPLYNHLIGGQGGDGFFDGTSACRKLGTHPTIDALPATFDFMGNLDNNEALDPTSTILLRCKWDAGDMKDVAVSWVRAEGLGRVFYTDLGKVAADLTDPVLGAEHIVPGLAWVLRR